MRLLTETKLIPIGDVKFTIGIIDRRRFHWIKTRFLTPTKFLTKLTHEEIKNLTPAEIAVKAGEGLTSQQIQQNEETAFGAQWDLVKYGVKGHAWKDAANEDVMLIKDDGGCVADCILELYELNGFLSQLANEIFIFNTMSEDQKKNS